MSALELTAKDFKMITIAQRIGKNRMRDGWSLRRINVSACPLHEMYCMQEVGYQL